MRMSRKTIPLVGLVAGVLALSACGSSSSSSSGSSTSEVGGGAAASAAGTASGTIDYWLWVSNQLPAYQQCADAFHAANPGITVKITQYGWDDYWQKLTSALTAGSGPDVFTDHLAKYPEFVNKQQILQISDALAADKVNTDIYQPGLLSLWTAQDGKIYGLPKDFDTIAIYYNDDMAKAGGITAAQLGDMAWNPTDGGTYEKVIAHLTVDKNGKRGDEAGFDKKNVKTYGLGIENPDSYGQGTWSFYPASAGWDRVNKNPWGDHYNFDSPVFQQTMTWWRSLISKGYMPPLDKLIGSDAAKQFGAGTYAMVTNGDWVTHDYVSQDGLKVGIAPIPKGPGGKRSSMFNGLADSINAATKNQAASIKWVEFTGSAACQDIVAKAAVVFPAIPEATDKAIAAFKTQGLDMSPFTDRVKDKETFLFPITDHAADVLATMNPVMQSFLSFKSDANAFTTANTTVNQLFQQ